MKYDYNFISICNDNEDTSYDPIYILRQVRLDISQHHLTLVLLEATELELKKIGQTNHEGN